MITTYILVGLVAVVVLWFVIAYNRFVNFGFRIKEALSDIDVQSKRRYDLIPNLVETVKGYVKHEAGTLESVTKARTDAMNAGGSPIDKAQTENMLSTTLKTLFAVSESYPDLKANANFLDLQRELADTENKMMAARRFYNSTVRDLNVAVESFPSNIVAGIFSFKSEKFFETQDEAERKPVQVQF